MFASFSVYVITQKLVSLAVFYKQAIEKDRIAEKMNIITCWGDVRSEGHHGILLEEVIFKSEKKDFFFFKKMKVLSW